MKVVDGHPSIVLWLTHSCARVLFVGVASFDVRTQTALALLQPCVQQETDSRARGDLQWNLGALTLRLGRSKEAVPLLQQALATNPHRLDRHVRS